MKRQAEYHHKRSETHQRVTVWLEKTTDLERFDLIRVDIPRATYLMQVLQEHMAAMEIAESPVNAGEKADPKAIGKGEG